MNASAKKQQDKDKYYDVIIIGAGASGLMCARRAAQRGLSVIVLDKSDKPGKKILISGGGRCNFTNLYSSSEHYLSPNPHFCKSALSRYTPWHFIECLQAHHLTYQEKALGQLFCQQKSSAIVEMLMHEAKQQGAEFGFGQTISDISYQSHYRVQTQDSIFNGRNLVIACGGPSFPNTGASDFALRIAKQFGIKNTPFSPALVPFTLAPPLLSLCQRLAGITVEVSIRCQKQQFRDSLLFTHKGISGPAVLQISSYWKKNQTIAINLCPDQHLPSLLIAAKAQNPKQQLSQCLIPMLAKKFINLWLENYYHDDVLQSFSEKQLKRIGEHLQHWEIVPAATQGMKKAEVCLGGIHPDALSSQTFECKQQAGLYAIGEAVDVTGWLGGYNLQWAWSSGWCCGDTIT